MAILTKTPRGTQDILPSDSYKWQYVERVISQVTANYGVKEIRTPTFEHTELFQRSVGDTTDVVQKEMYTFTDKSNRSITLRPEGTAGVARAIAEHGLLSGGMPLKVFYVGPFFRYEKPQAGRLREFHQFGVEIIGSQSPSADVETISLAHDVLTALGIKDLVLEINSIGCPACRAEYYKALRDFFEPHKDKLCETCLERLEKNPMRILDCKSPVCKEISAKAPRTLDYLCDECHEHFESLKNRLDMLSIPYKVNPEIVRGLDYYTKTVFEFISNSIGSQGTVCGGGRYDGLYEALGMPHTPSLGFGMGIERLIMVMESCGCVIPEAPSCLIYIGNAGAESQTKAMELVTQLRRDGISAECDIMDRSVKAQMKYADKSGARYSCIIGSTELETGCVQLKDMLSGEKADVAISASNNSLPSIANYIKSK